MLRPRDTVVVVGAGHAGVQVADSLRDNGFDGTIALFGDEAETPYQRPPLSKELCHGSVDHARLPLRSDTFFTDRAIDFHRGTRIEAVDRGPRHVVTEDGRRHGYDALVLATGARNRIVGLPGSALPGIHYLRTLREAAALHAALGRAGRVTVVGAGFIGLELAAAARRAGIAVSVLEQDRRPMTRAVSVTTAEHVARRHSADGIDLVLGEGAAAFEAPDGRVAGVRGRSGRLYPADVVVVGAGVVPATELAAASGVEVADGIVVDEYLRTSDAHIWAAGDCAAFPCLHAGGRRVRLESVQNATDQARVVAANLMGAGQPYRALPRFWSKQGEVRLQIAGLAHDVDRSVVRGDPGSHSFSIYHFRANGLAAVESVNKAADHGTARRLLEHAIPITPGQAADERFDLKAHSAAPATA